MTEMGFAFSFGKLKSFYGDKAFHPDRVKIIAKSMRSLTDQDFEEICAEIIANHNSAPTLKDFLKIGQSYLALRRDEDNAAIKKKLESEPRCTSCDGDGFVSAIKQWEGREYSYSFACSSPICLAAKIYVPPGYPKWSEEFATEYTRQS